MNTMQLITWFICGVNATLACVQLFVLWKNERHLRKLRDTQRELDAAKTAVRKAGADFIARVSSGHVLVQADDGRVGVLAIEPAGHGLRLHVVPPDEMPDHPVH